VYLAHREPAHWTSPLQFDPHRFLDGKPTPYAFFPFGGGARRCIGMAFALFEMRIITKAVLASVRLVRAKTITPIRRGVTLVPSDEMPVIATSR
jgi:cytochrome P450